jgi:hypothetical protein
MRDKRYSIETNWPKARYWFTPGQWLRQVSRWVSNVHSSDGTVEVSYCGDGINLQVPPNIEYECDGIAKIKSRTSGTTYVADIYQIGTTDDPVQTNVTLEVLNAPSDREVQADFFLPARARKLEENGVGASWEGALGDEHTGWDKERAQVYAHNSRSGIARWRSFGNVGATIYGQLVPPIQMEYSTTTNVFRYRQRPVYIANDMTLTYEATWSAWTTVFTAATCSCATGG